MKMIFLCTWVVSLISLHVDAFSTVRISQADFKIAHLYARPSTHSLYATKEKTLSNVEATDIFLEPRIVVKCQDAKELESGDIEEEGEKNARSEEEEYVDDNEDEKGDEEEALQRRRRAAMAARLLKKGSTSTRSRSASVSESAMKKEAGKKTSVGERRIGSASKARSGRGGLSGSILKGVRSSAIAAAAAKKKLQSNENPNAGSLSKKESGSKDTTASAIKQTVIQSTVDAILDAQNKHRSLLENASMRMGLLGNREPRTEEEDSITLPHFDIPTVPAPGTELIPREGPLAITPMRKEERIRQNLSVRVATDADDFNIAQLRLSVFSDFTPELRSQFCQRSCEVLHNRRLKGATCIVASVNYRNDGSVDGDIGLENEMRTSPHNWIIGSAECSTHEFSGTELGTRRPVGSVLYITEVAVSPNARRCGAGSSLLKVSHALIMTADLFISNPFPNPP